MINLLLIMRLREASALPESSSESRSVLVGGERREQVDESASGGKAKLEEENNHKLIGFLGRRIASTNAFVGAMHEPAIMGKSEALLRTYSPGTPRRVLTRQRPTESRYSPRLQIFTAGWSFSIIFTLLARLCTSPSICTDGCLL